MRKRESNNGKIDKKDDKDNKGKDVSNEPSAEKKEKDNKKEDDKSSDGEFNILRLCDYVIIKFYHQRK